MASKIFRIIIPILILSSGVLGTILLVSKKSGPRMRPAPKKEAPLVQVVEAEKHAGSIVIETYASTEAEVTLSIAAEVGGRIIWVNPQLKEGGKIEKNVKLFKIDPTDYQLKVRQAKAALIEAQYNLDLAKAKQSAAIEEYKAYQKIRVNTEIQDDAKEMSRLAKYEPQVESAIGALESAKAGLKIAELNLARTVVSAPADGYFSSVSANEGRIISANQSVAELINAEPVILKAPVLLSDLKWLSFQRNRSNESISESPAIITKKIGSVLHHWNGKVKRSLREIDESGGKAILIVEVDQIVSDHDLELPIGLFVDIALQGRLNKEIVEIPIQTFRPDSTVWIVNANDQLEIRKVTVDKRSENSVFISNGLSGNEKLISSNLTAPIPGMEVRILGESRKAVQVEQTLGEKQKSLSEEGVTGGMDDNIRAEKIPRTQKKKMGKALSGLRESKR